jgi:hypothetical protein
VCSYTKQVSAQDPLAEAGPSVAAACYKSAGGVLVAFPVTLAKANIKSLGMVVIT